MPLSSRVCGREFCSKSKGIGYLSTTAANAGKLILKDMFSPSISTNLFIVQIHVTVSHAL